MAAIRISISCASGIVSVQTCVDPSPGPLQGPVKGSSKSVSGLIWERPAPCQDAIHGSARAAFKENRHEQRRNGNARP